MTPAGFLEGVIAGGAAMVTYSVILLLVARWRADRRNGG